MSARWMLEDPLIYLSWVARHASAVALVVLSGRALWLGIDAATPEQAPPSHVRGRPEPAALPASALEQAMSASRPSLEDLKKLEGSQQATTGQAEAKESFSLRSIVVNFGPPRSEVFINGRRVGNTPYAGQVSCRPGDTFSVDVVPARGAPIHRDMRCVPRETMEYQGAIKDRSPETSP